MMANKRMRKLVSQGISEVLLYLPVDHPGRAKLEQIEAYVIDMQKQISKSNSKIEELNRQLASTGAAFVKEKEDHRETKRMLADERAQVDSLKLKQIAANSTKNRKENEEKSLNWLDVRVEVVDGEVYWADPPEVGKTRHRRLRDHMKKHPNPTGKFKIRCFDIGDVMKALDKPNLAYLGVYAFQHLECFGEIGFVWPESPGKRDRLEKKIMRKMRPISPAFAREQIEK